MPLYTIDTMSANEFLQKSAKIPKFQRRSVWTPRKRFQFLLSVFRGYPLGTVVLRYENEDYWLVDGRQRREALQEILKPDAVWQMAKSSLKLKQQMSEEKVIEQFEAFVHKYLFGQDQVEDVADALAGAVAAAQVVGADLAQVEEAAMEAVLSVASALEEAHEEELQTPEAEPAAEAPNPAIPGPEDHPYIERFPANKFGDLHLLLEFIVFRHSRRSKYFVETFDFSAFDGVPRFPYLRPEGIDESKVTAWIEEKAEETSWTPSLATFLESWLEQGEPGPAADLRTHVTERWARIATTLRHLRVLRNRVREARLSFVQLTESASADDEKMIFDFINTSGVKLTLPEILSARPSWDLPVPPERQVDVAMSAQVAALRKKMGIDRTLHGDEVRRWDYAATVLDRVNVGLLFADPAEWTWERITDSGFQRKVNLGFRLLCGRYLQALMRDDVMSLAGAEQAAEMWGSREFENSLDAALHRVRQIWLFNRLGQWRFRISSLSESIALAFALLIERKWRQEQGLGHPGGQGPPGQRFASYAVHVFDTLVFQYLDGRWQGGGDRKVAEMLAAPEIAPPTQAEWSALLERLLGEDDPGMGRAGALLAYVSAVMGFVPDAAECGDVDHIIAKSLFPVDVRDRRHCLANLNLLPMSVNRTRNYRSLHTLEPGLKLRMEEFTRIPQARFAEFASPGHLDALYAARRRLFTEFFIAHRTTMIEDPFNYDGPTGGPELV